MHGMIQGKATNAMNATFAVLKIYIIKVSTYLT